MSGINRDEWLTACVEAGVMSGVDDQQAITIAEFAEMFQIFRTTAARRLRLMVAAGKATETTKMCCDTYGRRIAQKAYRLP